MMELRGITWNHSRGYLPMVATAQRFSELHREINIHWEKRSLQQFGGFPLDRLAERFDLLVIDHPLIGTGVERGLLLPLDEHLPEAFLADQDAQSVGRSHESYAMNGHQWALAIDAASPICGWRPDLLAAAGAQAPDTWAELLTLAERGLVAIPGIALDSLMSFYMLCVGLGEAPFARPDQVVSADVAVRALEMLRELTARVSPDCAIRNPIATWELLAASDFVAVCPFAYGYSNYSRPGYANHIIEVGGLIRIEGHTRCRSTLGGAGLAISSLCRHSNAAVEYCRFVASPECQRALYFDSGGQPGHRLAWLDEEVNRRSHGFFRNALATLDNAWLRPRWSTYPDFQDGAAPMVHKYLWSGGKAREVAKQMNDLVVASTRNSKGYKALYETT